MLFTKANTEKLRDNRIFQHVRHSPAPNTPHLALPSSSQLQG
jgi:hypothetical protein